MTTTPFIWLGSKRAAKRGVGEKAALLDYATKMSLPVPAGAVLLDEFYQLLLEAEIIYVENGRLHTHDPIELYDALYTAVRFPKLDKPTIIRTAFSDIDQEDSFPTGIKLNVDMLDAQQLADSLCELWSLISHNQETTRKDFLIQEMISPQLVGIVKMSKSLQLDQVTLVKIHSQQTIKNNYQLPKLTRWQRSSSELPPFAQRLQKLLRGIRNAFGKGNRQIEWMDDGEVCWLLQIKLTD